MAALDKAQKVTMSDSHKAALAQGREQGRVVRRYLEALEQNKPKRGRKRTADSVKRQLASVTDKLEAADPLAKLHLLQTRRDLEEELARMDATTDFAEREAAFVKAAKAYGERKGVSYAAWREAGVDAAVLHKACIHRGSH